MSDIFVTSDLHFCHDRDFIYKKRGFSNISEHDEAIIENWNKVVKWNDTVYILGDLMLCDNVQGLHNFKKLNGEKRIIIGNHDTSNRLALYQSVYNTEVMGYGALLKAENLSFFLSHYPTITDNYDNVRVYNLCGHNHTDNKWLHESIGAIYHVELDAHNMTPVSLETIIKDLKGRS